ncbi:hypothetical protein [Naasia sp. SYSU D00948]|uniref:hypothetical protein n=1 Tax=Naasia sp. SYSU D00948 TaxID=2817379 RepID=UPI001B302863|nr:hypothetical protein [Naasia sp. SYSU D00948]
MSLRRSLTMLPLASALLLAGCATPTGGGTPSPTEPPSPTPAPTVTVTAPPVERGPDTPYDLLDAWLSCRDLTTGYYDDPGRVEFATFEESDVVRRDDDLIYVYIETVDDSAGDAREVASECILGGTLGDPNQAQFGIRTRSDDRDPNVPLPTV